jgi:hypothetical protein
MAVAIGSLAFSHPESDERQKPLSTSLGLVSEERTRALAPANFKLEAATQDDFRRELTACLVLCAPSGMSGDDRKEWLRVAWATLRDIPADLLAIGCAAARKEADHPAKIVPAIMREVDAMWQRRRARRATTATEWDERLQQDTRPAVAVATPAQIEAIKAEVGLVTQPFGEVAKPLPGPARKPTRDDYIALGVDPAILDQVTEDSS